MHHLSTEQCGIKKISELLHQCNGPFECDTWIMVNTSKRMMPWVSMYNFFNVAFVYCWACIAVVVTVVLVLENGKTCHYFKIIQAPSYDFLIRSTSCQWLSQRMPWLASLGTSEGEVMATSHHCYCYFLQQMCHIYTKPYTMSLKCNFMGAPKKSASIHRGANGHSNIMERCKDGIFWYWLHCFSRMIKVNRLIKITMLNSMIYFDPEMAHTVVQ